MGERRTALVHREFHEAVVAKTKREGVIEGLERAERMAVEAHNAYSDPIDEIRTELERLRAEQKEG